MIKMTYNKAMKIQRAQLVYYRQLIGRKGIKAIKAKTKPYPQDMNPNKLFSVIEINKLVPRGGSIENLIIPGNITTDENQMAWHAAIKKGIQ